MAGPYFQGTYRIQEFIAMTLIKIPIGWITAFLVVFYWVSESMLDTLAFEGSTFLGRLITVDANELWMRATVMSLMIAFGVYAHHMLTKIRRSDERLVRMNACFLDFGPDPVDNINRLTALCGELLSPSAAFYNRMDEETLYPWGRWCGAGEPSEAETPRGDICRDLIGGGSDAVTVIRNLPETQYATAESCISSCGLHTYMGKTVRLGGEVVGSLCVIYREDYNPTEDDKRLMGIIASAIGVEEIRRRAQIALRESEERLRHLSSELMTAQEKERKRLALQLHDSVGQSLSALKFGIEETVESLGDEVDKQKLKPLEFSVPLIRQIIAEIRQIQKDLYPATLDDLGIIATINSFCKQYRGIYHNIRLETGIHIKESEVPRPLKPVIYRIIQEAMNNVAKHSQAGCVTICLAKEENSLLLVIEDDGRGFDSRMTGQGHFKMGLGLSSMQERAELSRGKFILDSEENYGTRIAVSWTFDERGFSPR